MTQILLLVLLNLSLVEPSYGSTCLPELDHFDGTYQCLIDGEEVFKIEVHTSVDSEDNILYFRFRWIYWDSGDFVFLFDGKGHTLDEDYMYRGECTQDGLFLDQGIVDSYFDLRHRFIMRADFPKSFTFTQSHLDLEGIETPGGSADCQISQSSYE